MSLTRRYVLTGAAIGLYFGLFFRPVREPSLLLVVGLSLLIAVVNMTIRLARGERLPLATLLKESALTFFRYAFMLAVLEGRHLAYDWGGKTAVALLTTSMGAVAGAWFAASGPIQPPARGSRKGDA